MNDCTILECRGIGGPSVSHGDLTDRMPVNATSAMGLRLARREAAAAAQPAAAHAVDWRRLVAAVSGC
jgi:hypothetical protein